MTKINSINSNLTRNSNQKIQNFKGLDPSVAISALRFLDNSPAIGACAVDLASMVIPRTIVDTKNRGVDAGSETAIREGSSTVNHALVGVVGAGAAAVASSKLNSKYGLRADKIFANSDSIDVFSSFWKNAKTPEEYYRNVLQSLEGLSGSGWQKISGQEGSDVVSSIVEKLSSGDVTKEVRKSVSNIITNDTGAKSQFRLVGADGKKTVTDSVDVLLDNMTALGKAFKDKSGDVLEDFVKALKSSKLKTALLGLGITSLIGVSIQPINKYLTKKRTGKDGFVGVQGREADKSGKFKAAKVGAALAMGTYAMKTIAKNPKNLLTKLQFSSKIPNINQFKFIYGLTIMSRILSSRDKNELRESCIKDFLGFTNWLILGGLVSKLTARALPGGKELINYAPDAAKTGVKKALNWITKSSVKSYDEVLLKNMPKKALEGLQNVNFKTLMQKADKATRGKVGKLAVAQLAGYLYSSLILGIGIAKLNIFITNKVDKSKKTPKYSDPRIVYFAQNNLDGSKSKIFSKIK